MIRGDSPEWRLSTRSPFPSSVLFVRRSSVWLASDVVVVVVVAPESIGCGGLSLPLIEQLLSSSIEHSSDISTSGRAFGINWIGASGGQTLHISRNADSRLMKLPKTWRSSAVATPTAFGMIFAVFSLDIFVTDEVGMTTCHEEYIYFI